jgi:hypothetical protein
MSKYPEKKITAFKEAYYTFLNSVYMSYMNLNKEFILLDEPYHITNVMITLSNKESSNALDKAIFDLFQIVKDDFNNNLLKDKKDIDFIKNFCYRIFDFAIKDANKSFLKIDTSGIKKHVTIAMEFIVDRIYSDYFWKFFATLFQ